ncbi:MAG: CvpA family protein [Rickettsiales bacterium]|nr:CvpA family protein [Rickettsiales bacterium]
MKTLINDIGIFSLNNFDLLILGIIVSSVIFGLVRGFTKSFISAAGWVISMGIGMKFYFVLEPLVNKYISFGAIAAVIAGITLFLVSAIAIAIINNVFYLILDSISGGLLDRSFGLLFGFIRGCLIVSFMFYILLMSMPQLNLTHQNQTEKELPSSSTTKIPSWAQNSQTILLLHKGTSLIVQIIPIDFERKLKSALSVSGSSTVETTTPYENLKSFKNNYTSKDSVPMILNFLPKEVLDSISQDDLVALQDKLTSSEEKAQILEHISRKYQRYIEEEHTESLDQNELDKRDAKYYKHMGIIENQIIEFYNPS